MPLVDAAFSSINGSDKIVGVFTGSFDTDIAPQLGFYIAYTTQAHGFTRPVALKSQFSTDQVNWYDENTGTTSGIAFSDDTDIYILHYPGNGVIYYRVIAMWLDDYDDTNPSVPPTVGSQSDVYFDSRLNYQKIYDQGVIDVPSGTISVLNTITHNLGYKPNVRAYSDMLPGNIWPAIYGGIKNYWLYDLAMIETEIQIYDDRVDFYSTVPVGSPASKIWYKIYYDG